MVSKRFWKIFGPISAVLMLVGLFVTFQNTDVSNAGSDVTYEKLKIFTSVLNEIEQKYVEKEDPRKLIYGAIKGMVRVLDPHSAFLTPEEYKELRIETKGEFGGIGIEITIRDGTLTVVSPIEDTPAYRAGLKAGDKLIKINGKITKNMTLMDAVKLIRGPKGEKVVLTILREGVPQLFDVPIVRDTIRIKSVKWRPIDDDIAYIRILSFQDRTAKKMKEAIRELEVGEKPLKGLILDLRNNPGGLLEQAVKVSDAFLSDGLIVSTKGRIPNQNMTFSADPEVSVPPDLPLIVLVNEGSASASEIVAGALQDHHRAIILGTPTFGKGSVQTIIPLEDNSGLRLTTALYYTPSGRSIQAKGIVPDILVETPVPVSSQRKERKPPHFLREKDLIRHIENNKEEKVEPSEAPGKKPPEKKPETAEEKPDPQLERAVELLRTWTIFNKLKKEG